MAREHTGWRALAGAWLSATACLAPPEGQSLEADRGPIIDLNRISRCPSPVIVIRAGELNQGLDQPLIGNCPTQAFTVSGVIDRDSDRLLFRWVANNGSEDPNIPPEIPSQFAEGEERRDPSNRDEPFSFGLQQTFPGPFEAQMKLAAFSEGQSRRDARLTLFVTDAPVWSFEADEVPPDNDFSRIPEGTGSVQGLEWTLVFEEGPCVADPPDPCGVQP